MSTLSNVFPEDEFITLPHKSSVRIAVKWLPAKAPSPSVTLTRDDILVVCLNGLMTTMASWADVANQVIRQLPKNHNVSLLCYDRYGQGSTTDHDPKDAQAEDPSHGHDLTDAVRDVHALVAYFSGVDSSASTAAQKPPRLILVGNSIGCAIARLYAQTYPGRVAGLLLLDAIIANANLATDVFPDPDDPSFDPSKEPDGVKPQDLRKMRTIMKRVFDPEVGNKEGLSRRNLRELLPYSDQPKLVGWPATKSTQSSHGPYITVVNHGLEEFARQAVAQNGIDATLTLVYMNPFWWKYHEGLVKITDEERAKGVIEAVGAGHFIQKERPDLVKDELIDMIEKVETLSTEWLLS
ncbi:hypothetical protein UCRPC4_g00816 [Phaeomoniella chlamydospora]|uniref:AB hydrolase-1 domain-containing protein n=1 Tax=Phaeomoniella chlamydospora TaxID=158046 RepID=A0A0G2F0M2_PHACM|nr:hypothetical protein UCRPC4_g00816 [Phaeomoniella chlamydospora]